MHIIIYDPFESFGGADKQVLVETLNTEGHSVELIDDFGSEAAPLVKKFGVDKKKPPDVVIMFWGGGEDDDSRSADLLETLWLLTEGTAIWVVEDLITPYEPGTDDPRDAIFKFARMYLPAYLYTHGVIRELLKAEPRMQSPRAAVVNQ